MGDVERPAQSQTRLNPLWLPADPAHWPAVLSNLWPAWLREMSVTPAGLGRDAFFHTRLAVSLTGVLAARRNLALDPASLLAALETPDFLAQAGDHGGPEIAGAEVWRWWQAEGRQAHNFDVHLRLGHLRERLTALLALPEYGVLWRPPFSNPEEITRRRPALVWRLADPRRRLRPYITSQLLALGSLLAAWPADGPPLLVVLHELENVESWVALLRRFPAARLIVATRNVTLPGLPGEQLLLSRLDRESAERLQSAGAGI